MMNAIFLLNQIKAATARLRERTGCREYSVALEQGKARVVRITYNAAGKATVCNVSDWMPAQQVAATMDAITV